MGTEMASLDNVKKRCVFVELVDGRANAPYEIILEESSTEQSDLQQIANRMVAKNKELASVFESGYCSFEREMRCVVKKIPQFTFEGVVVPFMHESQSSQNFDNILHSTPILHQNSSRTSFQDDTHSGNLGNVTTSKLLNTISPFDSGLDCDDVSSDNLVIASTSKELSSIPLDSEQGSEHVPSDSDEEVNAQEINSQIFPLSERNDKGYRRLDTKRYKMPSFFGTALTEKMKNAKTLLSENEYKAVYRTLADSIEIQTLHPHPDSIRFVVDTTLTRFQNLIIDKKDKTATNAIFYSKLKRIMEYKRRVAKQQFSLKGGRVKNVSSFDNQGPAAKKTRREVENDAEHATVAVIDVASYSENVKKLLQVCRTFGSPQSIKALYLLTNEGRRREIFANKFAKVAEILKTACPVLNQTTYLQDEFELMKGRFTS
ncbi:hypothetical protein OUZ56_011552 [Daphnia magna]|uniref:Uncharacterized protein n=1 Tax=Daphnia magna TaxID=35525 RepID=A0ABQ9Z0J3_9CRUS|nr:hypothetical protein OUZ56_011552 [Daphnia magna]